MKHLAFRLALALATFSLSTTAVWLFAFPPVAHYPASILAGSKTGKFNQTEEKLLPKLSDLPAKLNLYDEVTLQFVTYQEGWLLIAGRLWRSTDGGRQWQSIYLPRFDLEREQAIESVQFVDDKRGWAVGEAGLYRTINGGENWTLLRRSTGENTLAMNTIVAVGFDTDGFHGWIIENRYRAMIGDEGPGAPHVEYSEDGNHVLSSSIKYSADGGETWTPQYIDPTLNGLEKITVIDQSHAMAYGIAGTYFLDGDKWQPAKPNSDGPHDMNGQSLAVGCGSGCDLPNAINFVDERTGWIANSDGYVGRSLDGGRTWTDLPENLGEGLTAHRDDIAVKFIDQHTGWGLNGNGHLITSRDGGESWQLVENSQEFNRMFILDDRNGWAVSNDGVFRIPMETKGK